MALPNIFKKLFKSNGYGPELNDGIISKAISIQDWDSSYNYSINSVCKTGGYI